MLDHKVSVLLDYRLFQNVENLEEKINSVASMFNADWCKIVPVPVLLVARVTFVFNDKQYTLFKLKYNKSDVSKAIHDVL